ncbi:hypothetical protein [Ectobacillus panaciterrae]|uniref:hypothetical protein n=1 Tax=Ectobacillus panaciterrae TaxID=363872 RepID=UPI00041D694D|nr:hypothetical protein [Ectobacillus panaciterrae]
MEERVRKIRSDKKREIKPTITINLYECIDRLSYMTTKPIKDVAEEICILGLQSEATIDLLAPYFRRDYWIQERTLIRGDVSRIPYTFKDKSSEKRRISIRFSQSVHDKLSELAYALDMTVSSATALLLKIAIYESTIFVDYVLKYLDNETTEARMNQLQYIVDFINKSDENNKEPIDIRMLLSYIMDKVSIKTKDFKKTFAQFIEQYIED